MDYNEEWFTAHDLFSRVYVNDAGSPSLTTSSSSDKNHMAYGWTECIQGSWTASRFSMRVEAWDEDSWSNDDHLFRCALCHSHTATEHAAPALRTAPSTASGLADLLCSRVVSLLAPGTAAGSTATAPSATRSTSAATATTAVATT